MSILMLVVIFGLMFAYLATQNTVGTTLQIGSFAWSNIPLYLVALGALLLGILISWVINTVNWITSSFAIKDKESKLQKDQKEINLLQNQIHDLKVENARLRVIAEKEADYQQIHEPAPEIRYTEQPQQKPGFFDRLRHSLAV